MRWFSRNERIFQQPRVKLPVAMLQSRLEQIKSMIALFDCPIEVLRQWSCIVATDKGNYRNSKVICVTRVVGSAGGCITIDFEPMEVISYGSFSRLLVYDDAGNFIREQSETISLAPKDTLQPSYSLNL